MWNFKVFALSQLKSVVGVAKMTNNRWCRNSEIHLALFIFQKSIATILGKLDPCLPEF